MLRYILSLNPYKMKKKGWALFRQMTPNIMVKVQAF